MSLLRHSSLMVLMGMILACGSPSAPPDSSAADKTGESVSGEAAAPTNAVRLSDLSIPHEALGAEWINSEFNVFDDLNNLTGLEGEELARARQAQNYYTKYGVIGMGNYFYQHEDDPDNRFFVMIFLFDSNESLNSWWKWKYQSEPFLKNWTELSDEPLPTVVNNQIKKRVVALGRLMVQAQNSKDSDQHLFLLQRYMEKARTVFPEDILTTPQDSSSQPKDASTQGENAASQGEDAADSGQ